MPDQPFIRNALEPLLVNLGPVLSDAALQASDFLPVATLPHLSLRSEHIRGTGAPPLAPIPADGECATPKNEALRPLREELNLRAWSHLGLDARTGHVLSSAPAT